MVEKGKYIDFIDNVNNNELKYRNKKYIKICLGLISCTLVLGIVTLLLKRNNVLFISLACLTIISFLIFLFYYKRVKGAEGYYKENYLIDVLSFLLNKECVINFYDFIEEDIFTSSNFAMYERYYGNDKIFLLFGENELIISDIRAYSLNNDKNEYDCNYSGTFAYTKLNFKFDGTLALFNDFYKDNDKLKKVEFKDTRLVVYSDNEKEVKTIFTNDLIEDILYLKENVGDIMITIKENILYIGFKDKNLFSLKNLENNAEGFYDYINAFDRVMSFFYKVK